MLQVDLLVFSTCNHWLPRIEWLRKRQFPRLLLHFLTLDRLDCKILVLVQQWWAVICPVIVLLPLITILSWLSSYQTIICVTFLYIWLVVPHFAALKQIRIFSILLIGNCASMEEGFSLVVVGTLNEPLGILLRLWSSLITLTNICLGVVDKIVSLLLEGRFGVLNLVFYRLLPIDL